MKNPLARWLKKDKAPQAPQYTERAWRPSVTPVAPESAREKFLRERKHRRRAINRTKNKLAHASRRANW